MSVQSGFEFLGGQVAADSAMVAMLTAGETPVERMVAVWRDPESGALHVLPPCGVKPGVSAGGGWGESGVFGGAGEGADGGVAGVAAVLGVAGGVVGGQYSNL